ncbi:MAG TPA: hypothetical protein VFE05_19135 [Longimicrobiaceae bacterium]|jgi:hypothetical protein|nr:hypothetical protein [Longimicrobiaceae bacterium]
MKPRSATAALMLVLAACHDPDFGQRRAEASAGLGRCSIEEPGSTPRQGQSVFYVDRTATTGGTIGRYAVMLTCMTPGAGGTAVTLVLPNLADSLPAAARYRVLAPGVVLPPKALGRIGWAEASIPAEDGTTYRGMGGEIVVERRQDGGIVGSYLVALERAGGAPAAPARLVLGGAFAAPRNTLPLKAALPRTGR